MDSPSSAEKNERKQATTESRCPSTYMEDINNMRKQNILCDVTLVVQGKRFPAHRVMLAAASHVFRRMFTTGMKESVSPEVELRSVEPEIIELLLEFIYTSQIPVVRSNVQSLLNVANQYQMEPVKMKCVKFINGQIDATNCLGIAALADCMDCPELKVAAEEFIRLHFTEICRLDEFLQLDVSQLSCLLHEDQLAVHSETQVYNAVMRWLKYDVSNRRQHITEALRSVRLPLLSKAFLSETVKAEPLFQDNPECLQMINSGMCHNLQPGEDLGESSRPRRQRHDYCIAAFDGPRCHHFDPKNSRWMGFSSLLAKRKNATAVFWDSVIYILGGSGLSPIKHMDCYNTLKNSWYSRPGPPTPRENMAACTFEGKIYTSGGAEVGCSALDLFESYDTMTETWQVNTSMLVSRCNHGSVEANGLIYVCGGMTNSVSGRVLRNCEVYDPNMQRWCKLHGMRVARKNHGLVVVSNRIYAIGGQGATGGLDSVEYYDIAGKKWHAASRMPWRGLSVKCVAVGDVIYVLLGKGLGAQCLRNVLEYHTKTDRWVTSKARPTTSCVIWVVDM